MSIDSKYARIPLVSGQNQSVDKRLMPEGGIYQIRNLVYDKLGRLVKRSGRSPIGNNQYSAQQLNVSPRSSVTIQHGTGGAFVEYASGSERNLGATLPVVGRVEEYTLPTAGCLRLSMNVNATGTYVLVAWTVPFRSGVYYAKADAASGAPITAPTLIATVGNVRSVRVIRTTTDRLVLLYSDATNTITGLIYSGTGFGAPVSVVTDAQASTGFDACFDSGASTIYVAYRSTTANRLTIVKNDSELNAVSGANLTTTGNADYISVSIATTGYVVYGDSTAGASISYWDGASLNGPVVFDAAGSYPQITYDSSAGSHRCIWNVESGSGYWGTRTGTPTSTPAITGTTLRFGHRVLGRPVAFGGRLLVWTASGYTGEVQAQTMAHLVDYGSTPRIVGVAARGTLITQWPLQDCSAVLFGNILWFGAAVAPTGDATVLRRPSLFRTDISGRHVSTLANVGDTEACVAAIPCILDGEHNPEVGFLYWPRQTLAASTSTGLASRTYAYRVTYEAFDGVGRRTQSTPSIASTIYSTSSVTLTMSAYHPTRRTGGVEVVVWRNSALGSNIYYRVGSTSVPDTYTGTTVTYLDTQPDANITANEILYTSQNRLDWATPKTSRVACQHARRLWTADGRRVLFSNVLGGVVRDDALSFYADGYVQLDEAPVALGSIEGAVVALCPSGVWVISGDGKQETGDGAFNDPWQATGALGCSEKYGGQRSVAYTPRGLVYRSVGGIELLGQGMQAQRISDEVQDDLETYPYVQAVTVDAELELVRFYCTDNDKSSGVYEALCLVWHFGDRDQLTWSTETLPTGTMAAVQHAGTAYIATEYGSTSRVYVERAASAGDWDPVEGTTPIHSYVTLGRFHPGGVGGFGAIRSVQIQGEYRGTTRVQLNYSYNDGASYSSSVYLTASDSLTVGSEVTIHQRPARQRGNNVIVQINDSANTLDTPSEGVRWNSVVIEYTPLPRGNRLASAKRI